MISLSKKDKIQIGRDRWKLGRNWLYTAKMLKTAADKILIDYLAACERFPVIRGGAVSDDPDLDLYCPYMLLMGYALENILKGMIICESGIRNDPSFCGADHLKNFKVVFVDRENPSTVAEGHDFLHLFKAKVICEWCAETFNDAEMERALHLLHDAVMWSGRYPSPKKYDPTGDDPKNINKARTEDDRLSFYCLEPIKSPIETVEVIYEKAMKKLIELCRQQEAKLSERY
jgi:hypothetical protein